jgi:hypothetical protein
MTDNSKRTGAALEAHYKFLMWLAPTLEKFPRSHKFTIGDRIEVLALDVLEALIEANSVEQALRAAQFRFDRALHDLRSEFIVRENKLRDEYLAEVSEITASAA